MSAKLKMFISLTALSFGSIYRNKPFIALVIATYSRDRPSLICESIQVSLNSLSQFVRPFLSNSNAIEMAIYIIFRSDSEEQVLKYLEMK
jgi:hypothetical protein